MQTDAYGQIRLAPYYSINGLQYPLAGTIGSGNYESKLTQVGLYTFHEFTFDNQWTWNIGARATATYVNDTNPVLVPFGGTGFGTNPNDSTWAIEPVVTTSLSYKPVPWATLYATYNYTQAINDDSGNSGGGLAYNATARSAVPRCIATACFTRPAAKFEVIPNQLYASVAGYYQERQLSPVIVPGQDPIYPKVSAHGFEAALNYQPNKNLSTGINLSWLEGAIYQLQPEREFLLALRHHRRRHNRDVRHRFGDEHELPVVDLQHQRTEGAHRCVRQLSVRLRSWLPRRSVGAEPVFDHEQLRDDPRRVQPQPRRLLRPAALARAGVDFLNVTDQRNFEIANSDAGENLQPSEPFEIQGRFTYNF